MSRRLLSLLLIFMLVILSAILNPGTSMPTNFNDLTWQENIVQSGNANKIVRIYFQGAISGQSSLFAEATYGNWKSQLEQVYNDDGVKAVVIAMDSPGGEVAPTTVLYDLIRSIQAQGKSVVVSMQSYAASGGYYLSAPADTIFALPSTLTGSLGVIFSIPNYSKLADTVGYTEKIIKSGELKDMGSSLREMTDEEYAIFKSLIDESYDMFVKAIADGRKMSESDVRKIADGRIYSGIQAKNLGLIDELGTIDDATDFAIEKYAKNATVVEYQRKLTVYEQLMQGIGLDILPLAKWMNSGGQVFQQTPKLMYLYQP